jgi:hypothetical protein
MKIEKCRLITPRSSEVPKVQTFDSAEYPAERDVRLAVQEKLAAIHASTLAGKVNVTFGMVIGRYFEEDSLAPSAVSQADRLLFRTALAQVTFSRISVALPVQMKGLGF